MWKCCHLLWAKQHLFLNDVFALVFLVSYQFSTSAIMLWRYILFFNIVFFCKRQLSPTKQSHLLKWLKWKQYFLRIPMFAREHLNTLPLNSHFNFIYSNSFFFSCVHINLQSSVVIFLPHRMKIPPVLLFLSIGAMWWQTLPPQHGISKFVHLSLSDQESVKNYIIH